jgi:hypothetical protein
MIGGGGLARFRNRAFQATDENISSGSNFQVVQCTGVSKQHIADVDATKIVSETEVVRLPIYRNVGETLMKAMPDSNHRNFPSLPNQNHMAHRYASFKSNIQHISDQDLEHEGDMIGMNELLSTAHSEMLMTRADAQSLNLTIQEIEDALDDELNTINMNHN